MFQNQPYLDFSHNKNREWIPGMIQKMRSQLPIKVPAMVNGDPVKGTGTKTHPNPSNLSEIVTEFTLAESQDAERALEACERAKKTWGCLDVKERSKVLRRAADLLLSQREELMILMAFEEGKNLKEADGDVCEAIDFCRYYADQAEKYAVPQPMTDLPGETNHYMYFPRGISVAIAPWNFPLAIMCGMTTAPLAAGNPVIMKASTQSSAIGYKLYEVLREAGVPAEALHFFPGQGRVIGEYLITHPKVHVINFTGSREVGLHIVEEAGKVHEGQKHVKKVVAEMGGKNAAIIDDDADLDVAIVNCLYSGYGYTGQKCSAMSRVIVLENIYDKFKKRFIEGLNSMKVAPAENPECRIGPVIDKSTCTMLRDYVDKFKDKMVGQAPVDPKLLEQGCFVVPSIFEETDPSTELGQYEFFGPLVTMFKVKNLDEAISLANDVDYALTGGIFSRSPANIERVKREMECGNLYVNRGITGALVNRQPFGGFKLSGAGGGKAGGPDYLLHFLEPKTITENTMRRGFAPDV